MRPTPPHEIPPDETLAAAAARGDREAFSLLYRRHVDGLYDFAARITRDRDAAADVVQGAFLKAWTQLQRSTDVRNVKAWLYAVARNAAIDEVRRRGREVTARDTGDETEDVFATVPAGRRSDPEATAQDREVAALVWAAAAALSPQEYALLDLHVRRDLSADEIADALGLKKGAVYTRLSRLRDSVEETVTSMLLMRRGRRECPELDAILTSLGATELTRRVHAEIRTHLRECETCGESKRRFVSPIEILAGLAPVPAAAGLIDDLWRNVASGMDAPRHDLGGRGLRRRLTSAARRTKTLLAAALAVAVIGGTAGVLALAGGPAPVSDPFDVRSTTHEIGVPSGERVVVVVWSRVGDAVSYSVEWTLGAEDLPDAEADLPGDTTSTSSPPLEDGPWFFHLRTEGEDGEWTSTVHVGPFVIQDPGETVEPGGPLPVLAIGDDVVQEPRSGNASASLLVELSAPSQEPVEVGFATSDGTARRDRDYRPVRGRLTLAPGETEAVIEVRILADDEVEPDETLFVELADPTNATLGDRRGRATIVARTVAPDVTISSPSVAEGDGVAVVTVSLSAPAPDRIAVRWETRDGTATAGLDYTDGSGTVSFDPGDTDAAIRVPILGDTVEEPDETFAVRLSEGTGGARILDAQGIVTIRDDDEPSDVPVPALAIADRATAEGDSGTSALAFTLTLSEPPGDSVSVRYEVVSGTAAVGQDVQAASGTVRFSPGQTSRQISVRIVGDTIDEPDERFFVNLSHAEHAEIADARATGTIRDDDAPPAASIDDASAAEGSGSATLTVTLTTASSERVTVHYATTPDTASAGSDFTPVSGQLAFDPGETAAEIPVPIVQDPVDEPDETLVVELSDPNRASIDDGRAIVTIRDDDQAPAISIGDGSTVEGTGGARTLVLTVRLSNPSAATVRADYVAVADTAVPRQDFAPASGNVTFAPGDTSETIPVTIIGDTIVEPDETFSVVLSNPSGGTIGDGSGTVTIEDDDGSTPRAVAADGRIPPWSTSSTAATAPAARPCARIPSYPRRTNRSWMRTPTR